MLYGQVDGAPLGQLVRWRRDGVATYNVLFRDVKVNPVELPKVYGVWLYCDRGSFSTRCTMESEMCKKCSIQHKMYNGE